MPKGDYAAFRALDPFFAVVMEGLSRFVDGEHYFDNERALLAGRRTEPRRRTVECGLGPCRVDLNFQSKSRNSCVAVALSHDDR
jgi:hypothetical protein